MSVIKGCLKEESKELKKLVTIYWEVRAAGSHALTLCAGHAQGRVASVCRHQCLSAMSS